MTDGESGRRTTEWTDRDLLEQYARDLAAVYDAERRKRRELQNALDQIEQYASDLKDTYASLKAAHQKLLGAYLDTLYRLALAAEYRDQEIGGHILRISSYSALIAEKLGWPQEEVQKLRLASPMHDIGKIGIPDHILLKPGGLTAEEFEVMKSHTTIGGAILEGAESEIMRIGWEIARTHHERWNGTGYPQGLIGEAIPIRGRIVGLTDVWDAYTSKRHYKDGSSIEKALEFIQGERGHHFDPDLVDIFVSSIDEVVRIKREVEQGSTHARDIFHWSGERGKPG
jgi:putative two-component system response regulator